MKKVQERRLAAIMFADIVGYSRMMSLDEERTLILLEDFEEICPPLVNSFKGEILKKSGDEIFCEFNSAKHAVDASIEIQNALASYNDSRPKDFKLEVRIGIHIGDVVKKDDDIFGDGVNVASRIQPLAAPGGICISGAVSDALSSHPDYNIVSKGKQELKHIVQQHSIFELKTGHEDYELDSKIVIKNKIKGNVYWIIAFLSIFIFYIHVPIVSNILKRQNFSEQLVLKCVLTHLKIVFHHHHQKYEPFHGSKLQRKN